MSWSATCSCHSASTLVFSCCRALSFSWVQGLSLSLLALLQKYHDVTRHSHNVT